MGKKMGKKLQMKITLLIFAIVVALAATGTASAQVDPTFELSNVTVVDSGETFNGPTSIQDSIDSPNTIDGNYIVIKPGIYNEQVIIDKNLYIVGAGNYPEETTIQFDTNGDIITYLTA